MLVMASGSLTGTTSGSVKARVSMLQTQVYPITSVSLQKRAEVFSLEHFPDARNLVPIASCTRGSNLASTVAKK